jgi:hypothetical protein
VAALDLDMAFDAPGFIHGMSGSVFGGSGKASSQEIYFIERKNQPFPFWTPCSPVFV